MPKATRSLHRVRFSPFPYPLNAGDDDMQLFLGELGEIDEDPAATTSLSELDEILRVSEKEQHTPLCTDAYLFINNVRVLSASKDWKDVLDPATQGLISRVPSCTHQEVQRAVNAAQEAQQGWENLGFQIRREYLLKLIDVLKGISTTIFTVVKRYHISAEKWGRPSQMLNQKYFAVWTVSMQPVQSGQKWLACSLGLSQHFFRRSMSQWYEI
ncbi:methylmalonate-semialdehyde dehydrogenase [Penicillium taxi]|uniref:methylmalonate-semialdehyde dehydrogenase n=1 Tax=Penicillium taxi TaxID=168475 RepID=UPI0025456C2E|nr:methylmalonate-semialdehyde dehydrogenase [Penicillium taxi]KAJ5902044.1 methylmalonate-semialdehyde dehydrogenase [Penicillium taxi]